VFLLLGRPVNRRPPTCHFYDFSVQRATRLVEENLTVQMDLFQVYFDVVYVCLFQELSSRGKRCFFLES
jgi:hypothetical protein